MLFLDRSFGPVKNPALILAFGEHLRALRQQRGLSQQALADEADISWPTVQRVEAGTQVISLDVAASLARALGLSISTLLTFPAGEALASTQAPTH